MSHSPEISGSFGPYHYDNHISSNVCYPAVAIQRLKSPASLFHFQSPPPRHLENCC